MKWRPLEEGVDDTAADRGVSPVIGTVLLVSIAVMMAAIIGVFVLGGGPNQPPPETEFVYHESDGDVTVVLASRTAVEGEIEIRDQDDTDSAITWQGPIETGNDKTTDWGPDEDDTLQLIWTNPSGSQSVLVDTYEVQGSE